MRASPWPMVAALALAILVAATPMRPALGQSDPPPFETTTRLDALERVTRGQGPQTCFTRRQALAIETQRVYSEILVSSLACEAAYGLADGREAYEVFSARHEGLLVETRQVLESYLGDTAAFDAYTTRLANEQTLALSHNGTGRYCAIHRSRFYSLIGASPSAVRNYMEELAGRLLARQRGC